MITMFDCIILQNQENIDNIAVYDDCESGIDYQF